MRRRDFIAGCFGLPLVATAGEARAESGPLTRIVFPFAAGGSGDTLCRSWLTISANCSVAASSSKIVPAATG
jgi:tripartite-type tricarboxylate transporter receptor subunit TctC